MMKKLALVLVLTLAINFLALGGVIGWLFSSGKLSKEKVRSIREMVFDAPTSQPTTQPLAEATTRPANGLDVLLAKASGRSAVEQADFIQQSFDSQMAILDHRIQTLENLKKQVDLASKKLAEDRAALDKQKQQAEAQEKQAAKLADDKGFQDSLALFSTMPAAKVKKMFTSMSDDEVAQYLQAMQPRTASKIMKEFTTTEDIARLQKVMEKVRQAQTVAKTN